MSATLTQVQSKVKYAAGAPRETKYGPRINVVVSLPDGDEAKLWGNPDASIKHLRKGQDVTVAYDGKAWKLVQQPQGQTVAPPPL